MKKLFICLLGLSLFMPIQSMKTVKNTLKALFTNSSEHPFDRSKSGFWTNPTQEAATGFFSKLTAASSQRENWYAITPYAAEFWCTISNIGFLIVGAKHKCPELIFAGLASAVSHAIPKHSLNVIDKIGVLLVFSLGIRNYKAIIKKPWLLGLAGAAISINVGDAYLARNYGHTWQHVVWHLSAAYLAHIFLSNTK